MTMAKTTLAMGVALLALVATNAGSALAQFDTNVRAQNRGPYVGLGVGPNFQEFSHLSGGGADAGATYDTGFVGMASFGYALGNGLRFEFEPSYRRNELDQINGAPGHGHTTLETLMANAIYDIPFRVPGNLPYLKDMLPHVGVGAGVARVINNSRFYNGFSVSGNETVPAFQVIAGLDYAVSPALKVGIDYRYYIAHDVNARVTETGLGTKVGDFNDHAVLLTMRYEFGAPRPAQQPVATPPAEPAPPPPPIARNFTVYFDFNSTALTATARDIIRQAASNAQQDRTTRIVVTGHTDTSGTVAYNQRLSERRAAGVREQLVADGVAADEIVTEGVGKTDLAVPTPDGVREPRNRRVVIVLQGPGT